MLVLLKAGLNVAGFAAIVAIALYLVEFGVVRARILAMAWSTLACMMALHAGIIFLVSYRFALIARAVGAVLPMRDALELTFGSTLANLLLPTSLAGDAGRIWLMRRFQIGSKAAIAVGLFDRVIGLASLGLIVAVGSLVAPEILPLWLVCMIWLVVIASALLAISRVSQEFLPLQRAALWAILISVVAHIVSVTIAKLFLADLGISISLGEVLLLFPAVLLAASIPISVGGWGTRELAAVGVFATVGMDTASAVALAFMFGVTQVMGAAVGYSFFLLRWALRAAVDD